MFDKYICLWLYVLVRLLGAFFSFICTGKGCRLFFTDRTFAGVYFLCAVLVQRGC